MPYGYRKLSPQEREEIVEYRRAHGYPLHAPPHPFRAAGVYLISAANFEHRPIMSSSNRRTEFETYLLYLMKEIAEDLIAWVVLPNHYHVLLAVPSLESVSIMVKHLHGKTSREWNIEDNLTGKHRVWYKFADTFIRNEPHLHTVFNYIHYNPVKHGYVNDPLDWQWSSLWMYYEDKGPAWIQEQWNAYEPPVDFGKSWDDDIENDCTCPDGRCQESRYYEKLIYVRFPDEVIETQFRQDYHANTISTTRETYELVRDEFECEYIGEITVKGKGKMEAWHLLARKEERSLSHA